MLKPLLLAVMLLALSACAALEKIEQSPMTAQLVTNQITLRFIASSDDPIARANKVREVVEKIRDQVSGNEPYTLAAIDSAARQQIDWQSLSVADQALLDFALTKARSSLAELIGDGKIDPGETETISALLTWIDNAALRVR